MDLFDRQEIGFHELAKECHREILFRRKVYPSLVERGRMTGREARRRIDCMIEAERLFRAAAEAKDQLAGEPATQQAREPDGIREHQG